MPTPIPAQSGRRPVPRDPRTPLRAAQDRLAAARRSLTQGWPSRRDRRRIAERIRVLQAEIDWLTPSTARTSAARADAAGTEGAA